MIAPHMGHIILSGFVFPMLGRLVTTRGFCFFWKEMNPGQHFHIFFSCLGELSLNGDIYTKKMELKVCGKSTSDHGY